MLVNVKKLLPKLINLTYSVTNFVYSNFLLPTRFIGENMSELKKDSYLVTNHARGEMVDHAASQVFVRDFPPVISDEPPSRGGKNQGPSPLEYILVALCA